MGATKKDFIIMSQNNVAVFQDPTKLALHFDIGVTGVPVCFTVYDTGLSNTSSLRNFWRNYNIPQGSFDRFVQDYVAIPWPENARNWLRLDVDPADVTPDSTNISKVLANATKFAKAIKQINDICNNKASNPSSIDIFMDIEDYTATPKIWQYNTLTAGFTFPQRQAQYNQFGQDFANAILPYLAERRFSFIFGHEVCYARDLEQFPLGGGNPYDLYPSFLDGFLAVAASFPSVKIIFGGESSYSWRKPSPSNDSWWENGIQTTLPLIHTTSPAYGYKTGIMWGTWIDFNSGVLGFDFQNPNVNYFTPNSLLEALQTGAKFSTDGVWIYTQLVKFGHPNYNLPPAYKATMKTFRQWLEDQVTQRRTPKFSVRRGLYVVAAQQAAYNTLLQNYGYGPNSLSIPLYASGNPTPTHYGCLMQFELLVFHSIRERLAANSNAHGRVSTEIDTPTGFWDFATTISLQKAP